MCPVNYFLYTLIIEHCSTFCISTNTKTKLFNYTKYVLSVNLPTSILSTKIYL